MKFGIATLTLAVFWSAANASPLTVPFDFSRNAIGLGVTIKGVPAYMLLDTGVDPSVIDIARADALGLKIDRTAGSEATGEGDDTSAEVFPTTVEELTIAARRFAPVDALAMDMGQLSARYGRPLDGVLGYSFLKDKIVLIDYPNRTAGILDRPSDALPAVRTCRKHWSIALRGAKDDSIPVIADFHFGAASAPIALDTGASGGIALYQHALDVPGLHAALTESGEGASIGARGYAKSKRYVLQLPVGFGPFTLPAGQIVTLRRTEGSTDTYVANIGNKLFSALTPKMLLDYRSRQMTFYGDCR
jgi:hypothetical protein